jgi:hypothetical protein
MLRHGTTGKIFLYEQELTEAITAVIPQRKYAAGIIGLFVVPPEIEHLFEKTDASPVLMLKKESFLGINITDLAGNTFSFFDPHFVTSPCMLTVNVDIIIDDDLADALALESI